MSTQRFSRDSLPVTPWKNGGGTTREIASWPPGAALDDFGWRVSIATIATAGPFSAFAGVDRSIMLLDGDGVRLRSADGAVDHRLDVPHRPFAFSGDAPIDCTLLGGASSDFNVMTRRGRWRAEVQVLDKAASLAAAHGVLLVLRGEWQLNADGPPYCEGEGLSWFDGPEARQVAPTGAHARLAVVRIVPVPSEKA
ncbi:MAG: HutD family protein [Variovorax sp.]|nr:MAG: HutD family protein [Variovorax sp.]